MRACSRALGFAISMPGGLVEPVKKMPCDIRMLHERRARHRLTPCTTLRTPVGQPRLGLKTSASMAQDTAAYSEGFQTDAVAGRHDVRERDRGDVGREVVGRDRPRRRPRVGAFMTRRLLVRAAPGSRGRRDRDGAAPPPLPCPRRALRIRRPPRALSVIVLPISAVTMHLRDRLGAFQEELRGCGASILRALDDGESPPSRVALVWREATAFGDIGGSEHLPTSCRRLAGHGGSSRRSCRRSLAPTRRRSGQRV